MSSGFSSGFPDFYIGRSTMIPMKNSQTQLGVHGTPSFNGKRSLAEFQQHQQQQIQQQLGFYVRNVKPRTYQQPVATSCNQNYTTAVASYLNQVQNSLFKESEQKMMYHLHELEKQLLDDDDNENEGDGVSVVTNSEWLDNTIQNLIIPSPASSTSTSTCSSTIESQTVRCLKESIVEAATAISDGKTDIAVEILTRLAKVASARGSSEQRLIAYMVNALHSRVTPTKYPPPSVLELQSTEYKIFTENLYNVSPCFKLGCMAANLAILEAVADHPSNKLHVIDFDIGLGGQYLHLLHALTAKKTDNKPVMLKITAVREFTGKEADDSVKAIGNDLKTLANKMEICLSFNVVSCKVANLSREKLGVENDEALAVNFAYKLFRLPDESVTTENLRDALLRRVKGLSPNVVTIIEQELNWNTAGLVARVNEACGYYGALLESLDATEMGLVEEGLSWKIANSVACEGRDRVERCEVFGKWRARLSMAGFGPRPMSQLVVDSLVKKLNSGPRGNPGFTVTEQSGGICFGWMGRTLTVASAWC